jgi:hypothetical protein
MSVSINGTSGLTFNDGSAQTTSPFTGGFGFRNRIINGAMVIDQRNAGASVTPTTGGSDKYCVDRFAGYIGSGSGVFTLQQSSTAPTGFTNSLKITVTTADSSLASTDNYQPILQYIEGYNVADLGWGASGATTITVSFLARASATGTYPVCLRNNSVNRSYVTTFTINAADTWEYKTVTIVGDTSGTWEKTTSTGVGMTIANVAGTDKQIASLNTWTAGNYTSHSSCTNWLATNGATFYITGVQLEKGSTATSFDYRPYGTELALCQRYYYRLSTANEQGNYTIFGWGHAYGTGVINVTINLPVSMRTYPTTLDTSAMSTFQYETGSTSGTTPTSIAINNNSNSYWMGSIDVNKSASFTNAASYKLQSANNKTSYLGFGAEL